MRKYGLLISFTIALTFVSCAIVFVKHSNHSDKKKVEHKACEEKSQVGGVRGK